MGSGEATTTACLNCGAPLRGAYCAQCGQKHRPPDPSLREFLHETTHELTDWEGRVPTTLLTLFRQPGRLTIDVLSGRRARWLSPLRVYLICSVAYFVSLPALDAIAGDDGEDQIQITVTRPDGTTATVLDPEIRADIEQGWPARLFGMERIERALQRQQREDFDTLVATMYPRAMFVLLPLFAWFTWLVWRRRLRYPGHLYVALHLHAAWFGALLVADLLTTLSRWAVLDAIIELAALGYAAWYGLTAVRRVFGDSWPRTLARSAAVFVLYSVCLFATSLLLIGYILLTS